MRAQRSDRSAQAVIGARVQICMKDTRLTSTPLAEPASANTPPAASFSSTVRRGAPTIRSRVPSASTSPSASACSQRAVGAVQRVHGGAADLHGEYWVVGRGGVGATRLERHQGRQVEHLHHARVAVGGFAEPHVDLGHAVAVDVTGRERFAEAVGAIDAGQHHRVDVGRREELMLMAASTTRF